MNPPKNLTGRALQVWNDSTDKLSLVMLVVMNLIPLAGALFAGWDVGFILLIYWAENLVVGVFNAIKMATAQGGSGTWNPACIPMIPFFMVHYGIFCLVHGVFVMVLGGAGRRGFSGNPMEALAGAAGDLVWPVLALAVSHGCSFMQNYIGRGEYRTRSVEQQMIAPYGRIVVLHVVILFGGFVTMLFSSPLPMLMLLIVFKIGIDLMLHTASHRQGVLPQLFTGNKDRL